jgi:hypothetical protein
VTTPADHLTHWTTERLNAVCMARYRQYERDLQHHYVAYFEERPHLRSSRHDYSATSVAAALPPGCADLERLIPGNAQHRFIRSARSSQALGLALLGAALKADSSLQWFWRALRLPFRVDSALPTVCTFEFPLDPSDLNEKPRVSQLDVLVRHRAICAALEIKWSENGLGTCSCEREGEGSPTPGAHCAARVYDREAYWTAAREAFSLPAQRSPLLPCPLSTVYQAVRNVAAVRHLAGGRRFAAFVLLYDARNPFFARTGEWPGWPAILSTALRDREAQQFCFRAMSWQQLVRWVPLPPSVRRWAYAKHRLR